MPYSMYIVGTDASAYTDHLAPPLEPLPADDAPLLPRPRLGVTPRLAALSARC